MRQSLPDSLRADLSNPLKYVLRVEAIYQNADSLVAHRHLLRFSLLEIGSERVFYAKDYPIVLSAKITP